jgi:phosphoribosylformylglycinamidine cyclo-ligase
MAKGNIGPEEMYRTFNMGIGMVLVIAKRDMDKAKDILAGAGLRSFVIGSVIKGKKEVIIRS